VLITRSLRQLARVMQWLAPVMALLGFVPACLLVFGISLKSQSIIEMIIRSAFGWQEAGAGAVGYTVSQALTNGFQRGMFSNEAGMGSTPNIAAAAASWPPHPAAQGIVQMIGVFIDTIIICTASAMVVLLSGHDTEIVTHSGIHLIQQSMSVLVGSWGAGFVAFIMTLFALTSITANYLYAKNNLAFLNLHNRVSIWVLRMITLAMVLVGSLLSLPVVWQLADIIMALMAITNLTALLLLSPVVRIIARDYLRQRKLGVRPVFNARYYPDIEQQLAPGAWDEPPRE
jgi:Na+/alanine symporter